MCFACLHHGSHDNNPRMTHGFVKRCCGREFVEAARVVTVPTTFLSSVPGSIKQLDLGTEARFLPAGIFDHLFGNADFERL